MADTPAEVQKKANIALIEAQAIIGNRFVNIRRLDDSGGNGNFSLVFYANDKYTGKQVVLKFFDPAHSGDADRQNRFKREADILMQLRGQPNIVECIDGIQKLSVELSFGLLKVPVQYEYIPLEKATESLEDFIYGNGKKARKCLEYFKEMCKAVARIHSKNICHRDLKPSNFLLFPKGAVKLGDFGTAKLFDGSIADIQTQYAYWVGATYYCAPEFYCGIGIGDKTAYCADIFTLGAVLFEMFAEQVLTLYLGVNQQKVWNNLMRLKRYLAGLSLKEQTFIYSGTIDSILSPDHFPDIYAFNDFVPNSIRNELNWLYKRLTNPDFTKRLTDFTAIHRRLDICLLILKHEESSKRKAEIKKVVRELREQKGERDAFHKC